MGTGSKHKLDRVAGAILRERGSEFIYDIIRSSFTVESTDPRLGTLYDLPWKRIYTTNYDNAPEVARTGKRTISSVTLDDPQSNAVIGSIVHLNGYVRRISPASINTDLLLTDSSYAAARLIATGWLTFFEHDIRNSRAVIFAGYSLYDLAIDEVLLSVAALSKKAFFFISPDADSIEISTLERYGTVVPGGIDALVAKIGEVSIGYQPPQFATGLTALREIQIAPNSVRQETAASRVTSQLVYGELPEQEILTEEFAFDQQRYLITRKQDGAAREALRTGPWRDLLITGEIGSGKSASTLGIAQYLISNGYRVYYAEKGSSLISDLRRIAATSGKVAVIFDGYSPYRAAIAEYVSRRPKEHRVIMTERSSIQEFIDEFIDKTPGLGPVFEVALDRIASVDIAGFEALTNFGGFWEDRAGASVSSRQRYISDKLDGSLYRLLLEIIRSKKVQEQIRQLIVPIAKDREAARIFCSAMIVNALHVDFTISEWQYLFDRKSVRRMATEYSTQVRQFMSIDTSRIYVRNGLLSLHVLHAFLDDELIGECLVDLYERAIESSSDNAEKWKSLRIELMKFSSIEPMFVGATRNAYIFDYYEKIRVFGSTVNNPDYWLQLGIASTVLDDLKRGDICFKNAYARERARLSPNLTKIDNYAARFEMKRATAEDDSNAAFEQFIAANEKLSRQIFLDINRHYPFKSGRYFSEVAAKHYDNWNDKQKERFKEAARKIRAKAVEWKETKRQHSADVEILIKETGKLLDTIE